MSTLNRDLLMPTMHPAHRVRVDRKRQVLMHAAFAPEDARGVWIIALKRSNTFQVAHPPDTTRISSQRNQCRSPAICSLASFEPPATQVMRTGHNPRANPFSHPYTIDIVANLGRDAYEIPGLYAYALCVERVDPHRIR